MKKILLFIPMYNCQNQITRVLNQVDERYQRYINEIIVVNNRSTDDGEKVVVDYLEKYNGKIKITLLKNDENYGLGGSHKAAFDYAKENNFDYVIVLHGDDQGKIENILPILENMEYLQYDCLLGSRFMKGSKLVGYSRFRTFGNLVYNLIFTVLLGKKITDLGSGLNMYSVKMLEDNFYHKFADNLTFNCYMLTAVSYYKHKIKFFPITWSEDDQVSNVKMFKQAKNTLKLIFSCFFNKKKFITSEFRIKSIEKYTYKVIKQTEG